MLQSVRVKRSSGLPYFTRYIFKQQNRKREKNLKLLGLGLKMWLRQRETPLLFKKPSRQSASLNNWSFKLWLNTLTSRLSIKALHKAYNQIVQIMTSWKWFFEFVELWYTSSQSTEKTGDLERPWKAVQDKIIFCRPDPWHGFMTGYFLNPEEPSIILVVRWKTELYTHRGHSFHPVIFL